MTKRSRLKRTVVIGVFWVTRILIRNYLVCRCYKGMHRHFITTVKP
jgi:hypothetical protein